MKTFKNVSVALWIIKVRKFVEKNMIIVSNLISFSYITQNLGCSIFVSCVHTYIEFIHVIMAYLNCLATTCAFVLFQVVKPVEDNHLQEV